MQEDVDYKAVAESYQAENERLRLQLMKYKKKELVVEIDIDKTIKWVEDHYLFVIAVSLVTTYLLSNLIELFGVVKRRTY